MHKYDRLWLTIIVLWLAVLTSFEVGFVLGAYLQKQEAIQQITSTARPRQ